MDSSGSLNDIYNFIYIAVIILGGITMTLTIILNAKERDRWHRAMLISVSSIFFYMLTDFITYYFLGEMSSGGLVFFLITMSDTLFCVLVAAWIYAIMVLAHVEEVISIRALIIISVVYIVISQVLSICLGRYDSYTIQVQDGIWKIVLQVVNGVYDLGMMAVGIRCCLLIWKKYSRSAIKSITMIMSLLLVGYMIWIAFWDYSTWYSTEENLLEIYAIDPLILMYAFLSVFLIYYFYKTDPLKLSDSQVSSDEAVNIIADRCTLSDREREVLILVNRGMGNKQIAAELSISENTVKRHMSNIFKKTETQSRHELVYKISNAAKPGI